MAQRQSTDIRPFVVDEYTGEISEALAAVAIDSVVESLVVPAATSETLHWGRNYLYSATLATATGDLEVVVKQFRNQGLRRRLDRHGAGYRSHSQTRPRSLIDEPIL